MGVRTKFISETLIEQMLNLEMEIKNVGFVNIRAVTMQDSGQSDRKTADSRA